MIKRIVTLGVAVALLQLLSAATPAQAPDTRAAPANAEKVKDIRRLMHLTGSDRIGRQVVDQMIISFKENMPEVPDSTWREVKAVANPDSIIELIIPIYDRHLTHEQIKGLIAFFETPTGQAYIRAMPKISQDTIEVGQQWGMQTAHRMIKKLEELAPPPSVTPQAK